VNIIGILCGSDILPHHGLEYSDLLLKIDSNKMHLTIPVIIKGLDKLTWKKDGGLYKQTLEKLQDSKVEVLVIAVSGQVANDLRIQLENATYLNHKSLVFINSKDLAQFLYHVNRLRQKA